MTFHFHSIFLIRTTKYDRTLSSAALYMIIFQAYYMLFATREYAAYFI